MILGLRFSSIDVLVLVTALLSCEQQIRDLFQGYLHDLRRIDKYESHLLCLICHDDSNFC